MPEAKKEYHLRFMIDDTVYDRYDDSQELLAERYKSVHNIYQERCKLVFLEEHNEAKNPKKKELTPKKKTERRWPFPPKESEWW